VKIIKAWLCADRHSSGLADSVKLYVFPKEVYTPSYYGVLVERVERFVERYSIEAGDVVQLYITGLTQCTLACVKVFTEKGLHLNAMMYDRDVDRYRGMWVF
jgi:hypothetical protein